MAQNVDTQMTLDEAVREVLTLEEGLDLSYEPESSRYYTITRFLNRALRLNALEVEWSYYSDIETVGTSRPGLRELTLRSAVRPRNLTDDAVRLATPDGQVRVWAYILPRDSLHKYPNRKGLWASVTRDRLTFSRPLTQFESGLQIQVPVMREPRMFRLPERPETPEEAVQPVPEETRNQLLDFSYPDLITVRAAALDAATSPTLQPRVPTLEENYKDLMYGLKERDESHSDAPYMNDFMVPIQNSIHGGSTAYHHPHPHSDERSWI